MAGFKTFEGLYNSLTNVIIITAITALVAIFQIQHIKFKYEDVLIVGIVVSYLLGLLVLVQQLAFG